jgi:hypothetical protein
MHLCQLAGYLFFRFILYGLWNGGWDVKLRCVAASAMVVRIDIDID